MKETFDKYISIIEPLHLKNITNPKDILKYLLSHYIESKSTSAKINKLTFFQHDSSSLNKANECLNRLTTVSGEVSWDEFFIVANTSKKLNADDDYFALWMAFFNFYWPLTDLKKMMRGTLLRDCFILAKSRQRNGQLKIINAILNRISSIKVKHHEDMCVSYAIPPSFTLRISSQECNRIIDSLITFSQDQDLTVRATACKLLSKFRVKQEKLELTTNTLLKNIEDSTAVLKISENMAAVFKAASHTLSRLKVPESLLERVLAVLLKNTEHEDFKVCDITWRTLEKLKMSDLQRVQVLNKMVENISHKNWSVREAASRAVGYFKMPEEKIDQISEILLTKAKSNEWIGACFSLGKLRIPDSKLGRAIDVLLEILNRDQSTEVRVVARHVVSCALEQFVSIPDDILNQVIDRLLEFAWNTFEAHACHPAFVLGRLATSNETVNRVFSFLREYTLDQDPDVQNRACWLLSHLNLPANILQHVINTLNNNIYNKSSNVDVRIYALDILGRLKISDEELDRLIDAVLEGMRNNKASEDYQHYVWQKGEVHLSRPFMVLASLNIPDKKIPKLIDEMLEIAKSEARSNYPIREVICVTLERLKIPNEKLNSVIEALLEMTRVDYRIQENFDDRYVYLKAAYYTLGQLNIPSDKFYSVISSLLAPLKVDTILFEKHPIYVTVSQSLLKQAKKMSLWQREGLITRIKRSLAPNSWNEKHLLSILGNLFALNQEAEIIDILCSLSLPMEVASDIVEVSKSMKC